MPSEPYETNRQKRLAERRSILASIVEQAFDIDRSSVDPITNEGPETANKKDLVDVGATPITE